MHDVVTVNTSLGNVALTTGPGVQDDINKDAVGVNQLSDGTIRIVVADGIGKNVGSDTAARLSVESFLQANSMEEAAENSQARMAELAAREQWGDDAGACVSAVAIRRSTDGYRVEYAQAGDTQAITVSGRKLQTTGEDNVLGDYDFLKKLAATRTLTPNEQSVFDELKELIETRGEDRCRHIVTQSLSPREEGTVRKGELHAESGSWVIVFSDGLGDNINLGGLGQALVQQEKKAIDAGGTFTATDACELLKKIAVELSLTDKKDNIAIAVCKLP
jgi:serine/threonine protein phosphatase PrpC